MLHITIGILLAIILLVLLFADKVTPLSGLMSQFSAKSYRRTVIGLSLASVILIASGIYHRLTYTLPFITFEENSVEYVIRGEIEEVGYYSDGLIRVGEEAKVRIVLWENTNLTETDLVLEYPSGKLVTWTPELSTVAVPTMLEEDFGVKRIYQLPPYIYEEKGKITLTFKRRGKEIESLQIGVFKKEEGTAE